MRLQIITALLMAPTFAWAGTAAAQDTTKATTQSQDSVGRQYGDSQMGQLSDNTVLMKMHRTNQLEIRVGKLAQSRGSTAKVRSFGATLVKDHTANDQKVVALAKKLGVSLTRDGMDSTGRYGMRKGEDSRRNRANDSTYGRPDSASREGYRRGDSTYSPGYQHGDTNYAQRSDSMGRHGYRGERFEQRDSTHADIQRLGTLRGAAFDAAFASAMVDGHNKAISLLEQAQNQVQSADLKSLISSTMPTLQKHLQTAQSLSTSATTTSSRY
jgi:predicted outer membrane protein